MKTLDITDEKPQDVNAINCHPATANNSNDENNPATSNFLCYDDPTRFNNYYAIHNSDRMASTTDHLRFTGALIDPGAERSVISAPQSLAYLLP